MAVQIIDEDGQEYEFKEYDHPRDGDYYLDSGNFVVSWEVGVGEAMRAILKPIRKQHTQGGVVFEETGEVRPPKHGEWFRYKTDPICWYPLTADAYQDKDYTIVKPVALESLGA